MGWVVATYGGDGAVRYAAKGVEIPGEVGHLGGFGGCWSFDSGIGWVGNRRYDAD